MASLAMLNQCALWRIYAITISASTFDFFFTQLIRR